MRKPCKLGILVEDGNAGFLCDRELEDLIQEPNSIALHLQNLAALPIQIRLGATR
jgi:hypothetical protein